MTGNYVFRFNTVTLGPLGKTVIDLGEMIEGHISATVIEETPLEDDNAPPDKPKPGKQPGTFVRVVDQRPSWLSSGPMIGRESALPVPPPVVGVQLCPAGAWSTTLTVWGPMTPPPPG